MKRDEGHDKEKCMDSKSWHWFCISELNNLIKI